MIRLHITTDILIRLNACPEELDTFVDLWPNGVLLTLPALHEAWNANLDVYWFANALLSPLNAKNWHLTSQPRWKRYYDRAYKTPLTTNQRTLCRQSLRRADFRHLAQLLNIPLE